MISVRRTRVEFLPNFLVVGAMKAGTTSLYHYLREHPDVFMASVKELDFFVERANWTRGIEWYRRQFDGAEGAVAIGEASTAYTKHPIVDGVPERIARHIPGCRFVYVLRNPIDRIRSHYQHRVAVGAERAPISEVVARNPAYVTTSSYAAQVERYLDHFPREQLLLITSEDLRADRMPTMRKVFGFLGVDPEFVPATLNREYYRTEARATYSPAMWKLRHALNKRLPAAKRAKEFVDSTLPRLFGGGSASTNGARRSDELPSAVRDHLNEVLRDDVARLRQYMPYGFDGWGIA